MGLQDIDIANLHVQDIRQYCMRELFIHRSLAGGEAPRKDHSFRGLIKIISVLLLQLVSQI